MSETITFDVIQHYNTRTSGITVTAILHHGAESTECEAKLDTGSTHCIFKRSHGELLGLDIESAPAERISTVTGGFFAHPHVISLEVMGIRTDTVAYFAAEEFFTRNVLGRSGWLNRVKLGLIEYESKLLLSSYH